MKIMVELVDVPDEELLQCATFDEAVNLAQKYFIECLKSGSFPPTELITQEDWVYFQKQKSGEDR